MGYRLWGIGYGAWSTGSVTEDMIDNYLDHHRDNLNNNENFILK